MNIPCKYTAHSLMGRGGKLGATAGMVSVHAVEPLICNGDNFKVSLCGKKPQGRSLGWHAQSHREINCQPCLKKLTEIQSSTNAVI